MMQKPLDVRVLDRSDLPAVRELLVGAELPVDDLDDPAITFIGAFDAGTLAGVVGLQRCDGAGLLRSLAVAPRYRARGVAHQLCERVITHATHGGLSALWLLTTTAHDYFPRHGFTDISRDEAPAAIRATAQFASLCPASAHVMRRT